MTPTTIEMLLKDALLTAQKSGLLKAAPPEAIPLEVPKSDAYGDFATPIALSLSQAEGCPPRKIAQYLTDLCKTSALFESSRIDKIEIAGPGYLNFFLQDAYWHLCLQAIHREGSNYGRAMVGNGKRVQVEFVSANPTGPLHVAHGRAAALGDAIARLLQATGHTVEREYYINDIGGQMALLGQSTYRRYLSLYGRTLPLAPEGYHGAYIADIAKVIREADGDRYLSGPEEAHLTFFTSQSCKILLGWIKRDLEQFGIHFDNFFSEAGLYANNEVASALALLRTKGVLCERDGALWVTTTRLGDDKDRVVVRSNGEHTYFASDIAYHRNKFNRGFDRLINIWGADHHGYVARVKAAVAAMGEDPGRLHILVHQNVSLLRDGKPVPMSKRSGEFVSLKEVISEVGVDAARFFFLMRRSNTALDFDLELAKKTSQENPVYYVQYAHARLCSIMRMAEAAGVKPDSTPDNVTSDVLLLLKFPEECALMKQLALYPSVILGATEALEPHRLTFYLQTLAGLLHRYYFQRRIITDDARLTQARLALVGAVRIVVKTALDLLGVRAPETM